FYFFFFFDLELLYNASNLFTSETTAFQKSVDAVNKWDPFAIRKINDQLLQLERAFIDPQGLPGRPLARHVLFAESSVNTYAGSSFPGLADGMFEIEGSPDEQKEMGNSEETFYRHSLYNRVSGIYSS
ncbi:putative N-acetylated-alpha-linked acidic dipeptidase, partial [Saccostrea cucullata]|uniref:putative N-acetylated-alpha-linked acidic dipeptidase n=1 Tax=Saccostrea cuccullata TaxID=36930 RepID=UPI002ED276FC